MPDEMIQEEMRRWILSAVIASVLVLAAIKVRNELQMTRMYERQAVALERIADALDGKRTALANQ